MSIELDEEQIAAFNKLKNGSILCGRPGTGKTRTSLAYYYFKVCKGDAPINGNGKWKFMERPRDLYVITTAKKRDSGDWEEEALMFRISTNEDLNPGGNKIVVDSWNNIGKYKHVSNAFFIFDEQRVKGKGAWVKTFLFIAKHNEWILCSATPGDTWIDYIPVFIANGFYKNRSDFNEKHCIFNRFTKWPQIDGYMNEGLLYKLRSDILVTMKVQKKTLPHYINLAADFDKEKYLTIARKRWDPYENQPIDNPSRLCYLLRKSVNENESRIKAIFHTIRRHPRLIIFYNYTFELEMIKKALDDKGILHKEWNGKKHEELPKEDAWVYLVQYLAGAEGWNCITTDAILFYSLTYSYSQQMQAEGRIDRFNTPYKDLYYYYLKSTAPIDIAIQRALNNKKDFNENDFVKLTSFK